MIAAAAYAGLIQNIYSIDRCGWEMNLVRFRNVIPIIGLGVAILTVILFTKTAWTGNSDFPGTDEGARMLLLEFVKPGADCYRLTWSLEPTVKDLNTYFVEETHADAFKFYDKLWQSNPVMCPSQSQTELTIYKITSDQLRNGATSGELPGGYKSVAKFLNPGFTIYGFRWTEPGRRTGFLGEGLVYVNGHWVFIPTPWRALR